MMLAVEYVNTRRQVRIGNQLCTLRVNLSVDYIESRVSALLVYIGYGCKVDRLTLHI